MRAQIWMAMIAAWLFGNFLAGAEESPRGKDGAQSVFVVMSGRLQSELNFPISEAEVSCWWFEEPMFAPTITTRADIVVHSGADGGFVLMCPFPLRMTEPSGPEGPINFAGGIVVARHPAFGISVTPWEYTDAELYRGASKISEIPIELMPPKAAPPIIMPSRASASGTVRDAEGTAIPGATVTASVTTRHKAHRQEPPPGFYVANPGPDEYLEAQRLDALLSTTTDENGAFLLDGLPHGQRVALHVSHPEAGEATLGVTPDAPEGHPVTLDLATGPFEVLLPGAGSLLGRIKLPTEGSLPKDAHVRLTRITQIALSHRNVSVDSEGNYVVPAIATGFYQLELIAPPYTANLTTITIEAGIAIEAPVMAAGPGAFIAGTFVDATTGEAVANVVPRVTLIYQDEGIVVMKPEVKDGRFQFNARPGIVTLQVVAQNGDVALEDMEKQLVLKHGTRNESLQFRFTPFGNVSGRVVLPDGKPAAHATVTMGPFVSTTSDADGHFTITLSPYAHESPRQTITAALGNPLTHLGAASLDSGSEALTITVDTPASVSGRLVDVHGKPVAGYPISLYQVAAQEFGTRTDAQGKFHMNRGVPGYSAILSMGEDSKQLNSPFKPGEHRDVGDVPMEADQNPSPGRSIIDVAPAGSAVGAQR